MEAKVFGLMADVHLHSWTAFSSTNAEGVNTRLAGLLAEIKRCARETCEAGGVTVVIAGDIFHVRGSVEPTILNSMIDTLAACSEEFGTEFVLLAGNHDISSKNTTRLGSAVTALASGHAMTINAPSIISNNVMLVPWYESVDDLKEAITGLIGELDAPSGYDLILHAPIDGVIKGLPHHGLTPEWLAALPVKRVFSGHYHDHRHFEGDVYSIGALAHHTWSDIGTRAGFLLVYPDRVERRKSHLPEFIDLSQLVDVDQFELPMLVDKNYVRVKIEASKTKDVEAARQELLDMGAKAVIVQAMPKPPARAGTEHHTVSTGATLETSVQEFIVANFKDNSEAIQKAASDVLTSIESLGD